MNGIAVRPKLHHDAPHEYLVAEVYVDGIPLADFSWFAISLEDLVASAKEDGEFFILTCWCGIPECAGLSRGIEVRLGPKAVHWHVLEPEPERRYVFRRDAYNRAIEQGIESCRRWFAKQERAGTLGSLDIRITPDHNHRFFGVPSRFHDTGNPNPYWQSPEGQEKTGEIV